MARVVTDFNDSPLSNLATVSGESFAARARSRTPHPTAVRAILHCVEEICNTVTIHLARQGKGKYRNCVPILWLKAEPKTPRLNLNSILSNSRAMAARGRRSDEGAMLCSFQTGGSLIRFLDLEVACACF